MKLGGIYISVQAKTDKLKRDLAKAKTMTGKAAVYMKNSLSKINFARVGVAAAAFGVAAAYGMKKAIDAASDLQEVQGKFDVVFKDHKQQAEDMANVLVDSYAMSTREAKQYLSSIQDLLVPMGMFSGAAVTMSNEVVKLAADLGSFNNLPTSTVMLDIQSGLVGNFETMKKYGVILNETVVKQRAYNDGLWNGKGMVDANTKAQVAFKLMLEGSAAAIGDLERTQDSYANQTKKLAAQFEDLKATIGDKLLPVATEWVKQLNAMIQNNPQLIDQIGELAAKSFSLASALMKVIQYANLRSVSNTFSEGAKLAKDNLIDWQKFVAATFVERQKMVDAVMNRGAGTIDFDEEEASLATWTMAIDKATVAVNNHVLSKKEIEKAAQAATQADLEEAEAMAEMWQRDYDVKAERYVNQIEAGVIAAEELAEATKTAAEEAEKAAEDAKGYFERWTESAMTLNETIGDIGVSISETFADSFVDAILDADTTFKDFARNFLKEITSMIAKQIILNALKSASSSIFSAKGNTFDQSGVTAFAGGGVVNSPTAFAFAGGTGIMGEAGPEAIMPLKRGNDGNLGVASSSGEPQTVNYVIQAIDSKSFLDTVRRNPDAITMVMNEQMERGNSALNGNIRRVAQ